MTTTSPKTRETTKQVEKDDRSQIDEAPPAAEDVEMGDDTHPPQTPTCKPGVDDRLEALVDNAFKILVDDTTKKFGFSPRDVYGGVCHPNLVKKRHASVLMSLSYQDLRPLVKDFSDSQDLDDLSHQLVAVSPTPAHSWKIDFKSVRIRDAATEKMRSGKDGHLRETCDFLHSIPEASSLAERLFEAIARRVFSDGSAPRPTAMFQWDVPPTFSTSAPSSSSTTPASINTTQALTRVDVPRVPTRVYLAGTLSEVTLDSNRYYTPTASDHPLFDAFTINYGDETVVISVFQITISSACAGSADGYSSIRDIMIRVRELLKSKEAEGKPTDNVKIKVEYILVCPESETNCTWEMPVGWGSSVGRDDYRGSPFCIRLPGTLCYPPRSLRYS